ncbi:MAG: RNA-binding transcriptional accessory protein [Cyclobacteriaceae bacterium]|nr:RNA-binding transcriptional accessory protein [Cyclobacteriaceae bacterium]MCH8514880.1 RNA-binding transcriptional accessory protein [Cyclobacteriaceae bacterium]
MRDYSQKIAELLSLRAANVGAVIGLLEEGGTVPFIARYRKEQTGSLDEVEITSIRDQWERLQELDKRRESVIKSIEEQGKLTPELEKQIMEAETMTKLEDLYLPYKKKRKTRAMKAKEKGLEPLADLMMAQGGDTPEEAAAAFVNEEMEVSSVEEALAGARDIIAESINENAELREQLRGFFFEDAILTAKVMKGKEEEGQKYKDYFEYSKRVKDIPSHQMLALRRGEKELILMLDVSPDGDTAVSKIEGKVLNGNSPWQSQIAEASSDAWKRLIKPSLETELRMESKKGADNEAINVFKDNLRQLLLMAPLGEKAVLAIDPGMRTGCKVTALNQQGKLLEDTVIYPNKPQSKIAESAAMIKHLVEKHHIEAIAVGNGTGGRETEQFVRSIGLPSSVAVMLVNESGASVYSASEVAREEFPDHDLTVRGAVSIGRRLMDPLAELVKIDPKSIGVGQYQHDVDQAQLKKSLDETVESCVNAVGVDINTASKELLTYVAGLGPSLAKNIVKYRDENGAFRKKEDLKKVSRLGDKAYEQAAGFIRISNAENPLDSSAVHPESFHVVEKMAEDLRVDIQTLTSKKDLLQTIQLSKYVNDQIGLPTLKDIMKELEKPGRDPRDTFEAFSFSEGVMSPEDLRVGMELPGIVTNITKFGAFVDVGVHQDGLVHVSEMANRFISDPAEVVKVNQKVNVRVLEVDLNRKRIALSMKDKDIGGGGAKRSMSKPKEESMSMEEKLKMLQGRFK